jgi:hypothetical protein
VAKHSSCVRLIAAYLALALGATVAEALGRVEPALERVLAQAPPTAAVSVIVEFEGSMGATGGRSGDERGRKALAELRQRAAVLRRPAEVARAARWLKGSATCGSPVRSR